jgi:hypothetical protein
VPCIERSSRFDDGGRGLIRRRTPCLAVEARSVALREAFFDGASKLACPTAIRRSHAVGICWLPCVIRAFGLRRDEDRKDGCVVARSVEVLQIQAVVPRLVVVVETELTLAALELNREDG